MHGVSKGSRHPRESSAVSLVGEKHLAITRSPLVWHFDRGDDISANPPPHIRRPRFRGYSANQIMAGALILNAEGQRRPLNDDWPDSMVDHDRKFLIIQGWESSLR